MREPIITHVYFVRHAEPNYHNNDDMTRELLDPLDEECETQRHIVNADGDYVYTDGKWNGMVFHPYNRREVCEIIPTGVMCEITDDHAEMTVLLRKDMYRISA